VSFDPESPRWLFDRLGPHVTSGVFTPIFREEATWREVGADVRHLTGARGNLLISTNLDNDDALAADFIERIQRLASPGETRALFLERGVIACGERAYLRLDRDNAFCIVAEPWGAEPATAWRDWHIISALDRVILVLRAASRQSGVTPEVQCSSSVNASCLSLINQVVAYVQAPSFHIPPRFS
jgi:hypothetical protein